MHLCGVIRVNLLLTASFVGYSTFIGGLNEIAQMRMARPEGRAIPLLMMGLTLRSAPKRGSPYSPQRQHQCGDGRYI